MKVDSPRPPRAAPSEPRADSRLSETVIDNVSVTIETFVGDATLTVAELNALRVGSVVPLEASLNELAELRVNGATIARGELVAIGDKFGVRITALSP